MHMEFQVPMMDRANESRTSPTPGSTLIATSSSSLVPETRPPRSGVSFDTRNQATELADLAEQSSSQHGRSYASTLPPQQDAIPTVTAAEADTTSPPSSGTRQSYRFVRSSQIDVRYNDTLLPIDVPLGYPEINFKPVVLRSEVMMVVIAFNLLCLGSIVAVVRCADNKGQYHTNYPHIRLVVRYVPTVVGTLTTLLYRSMRDTYVRIQPYISMANNCHENEAHGSKSVALQYITEVELFKGFTWQSHNRHILRIAIILGSFLATQIAGYKAALFSTVQTDEGWILLVHTTMGWLLFTIYLLIILLYTWTLLKVWPATTGLKWDPICIVDQLALFHGSNVLGDFRILEESPKDHALHLLGNKTYRLGYWEKGCNRDIWYGIGRTNWGSPLPVLISTENTTEDAAANTHEIDPMTITSPLTLRSLQEAHSAQTSSEGENSSNVGRGSCQRGKHIAFCHHPQEHSYFWNQWCRSSLFAPWTVYFWAVPIIGGLGLCAYSAASGVVKRGFVINDHRPYNSTSNAGYPTFNITSSGGDLIIANFDPGNDILWALFVFRSILVILSSSFAITWISNVDQSIRFSQPFANMYHKLASAEDSILLDYLWGLPGLTTLNAVMNGHYKVAWFSFLNLVSPSFPIIVGGLFTIVNTGEKIYFTITPGVFYLVLAYLVIYLLSLPLAWPRRNRRLLRWHNCIADYISLFYASYLIHDPNSQLDISASNATKRHLESRVFLQGKQYTIGLYNGVDGNCHFGLDVAYLGEDGIGQPHVRFQNYERGSEDAAEGENTSVEATSAQRGRDEEDVAP